MPSAAHYVGYVEDEETPEMIMKKFEELERIMALGAERSTTKEDGNGSETPQPEKETDERVVDGERSGGDPTAASLSEAQLNELFTQTSMFTVRTALDGNDLLYAGGEHFGGYGVDEADWSSEEDWFSDDDFQDEDGLWGMERGQRPRIRTRAAGAQRGHSKGGGGGGSRSGRLRVAGMPRAYIRLKKPGRQEKNPIYQIKVPKPPIPLSWGRTVKPFRGVNPATAPVSEGDAENSLDARQVAFPDISSAHLADLHGKFLGVMINLGWASEGCEPTEAVKRLASVQIPKLCRHGFILIWLKKGLIQPAWEVLTKWGYVYVENLTWVVLNPNNSVHCGPGALFWESHLTLYIFRKAGIWTIEPIREWHGRMGWGRLTGLGRLAYTSHHI